MRQRIVIALLLASSTMLAQMPATESGGGISSAAAAKRTPYYVDPVLLDLSRILPLPPTQDSETTKQELAYVHKIEQTRTPQQVAQAQADDKEESLFIYTGVIGTQFTKADLPLTAALSSHVHNDEAVLSEALKDIYKRPRPYNYDISLHPVCKTDKEPSTRAGTR
jgi:acid phosphatase (class A)